MAQRHVIHTTISENTSLQCNWAVSGPEERRPNANVHLHDDTERGVACTEAARATKVYLRDSDTEERQANASVHHEGEEQENWRHTSVPPSQRQGRAAARENMHLRDGHERDEATSTIRFFTSRAREQRRGLIG
eukprot:gnl/TRDRNA2_/TRDRNA2_177207_c2_seq5.p1 gnl/TRDRNA2_/TRDRNA2_177207_c2~~gnl/TRDRNA2_/TRDRNA2_177207_c2_seq5.p1  ORF type:complete len:134 (-),score=12.71 gnl/TRDRNA2_/TRDRNA2_177207_c2_seq5:380-781(-)